MLIFFNRAKCFLCRKQPRGTCVFFQDPRMSAYFFITQIYLLHVGLMLRVHHPLSIMPVQKQGMPWQFSEQSSKHQALLSNECPREVRGKTFLKWTSMDLSSKLPLTYGVMLTIIKVFILFLLCLQEQGTSWKFLKQISKFFFQLSLHIYSLPAQTEEERKAIFGSVQKRGPHCDIISKSSWLI